MAPKPRHSKAAGSGKPSARKGKGQSKGGPKRAAPGSGTTSAKKNGAKSTAQKPTARKPAPKPGAPSPAQGPKSTAAKTAKTGGAQGAKRGGSRGASRGNTGPLAGAARSATARKGAPKGTGGFQKQGGGPRRRFRAYSEYEKETPTPAYLARLFAAHEYEVTERELEAYWRYYELLRARNAECDLTRIMGIEATVLKHFIDSAIVADLLPIEGPLLDIGTGAGFPGAPIAIRRPDLHVILAESRGKRVDFLTQLKEELRLDNVTIHGRSVRAEDAPPARSVITRALETIPATLERMDPWLETGARIYFCKGPNCGQEVTDGQQLFKGRYKMVEDIRYSLPATDQRRRLVVFAHR